MKRIIKVNKILVSLDSVKALMRDYGCCKAAVYNALRYSSDSKRAKDIRKTAIKKYKGHITSVIILDD